MVNSRAAQANRKEQGTRQKRVMRINNGHGRIVTDIILHDPKYIEPNSKRLFVEELSYIPL
jgi:hypothetical protein